MKAAAGSLAPRTRWSGNERLRLRLAEAELAWLHGDLARAEALCRALESAPGDAGMRADLALLRAQLHFDLGDGAAALALLDDAQQVALGTGDAARGRHLLAQRAYWTLAYRFGDALARWGPVLQALRDAREPAVLTLVEAYTAQVAMRQGELAPALVAFGRAYAHALEAGALRHAITAATNISSTWANLGRHDESLNWAEQALVLARPLQWPVSTGQALGSLGHALLNMGRFDGARAALEESHRILSAMPASRHTHKTLMPLADCLLAQGAPREAEALFAQVEAQLRVQGEPELLSLAVCARAEALHAAGEHDAADRHAREALAIARREGARLYEIDALTALAMIHAADDSRARGHLEAVLERGRSLPDWRPSPSVLTDLADICLRQGDARAAWPLLQEAHRLQQADAEHRAERRAALAEAAYVLARERAAAEAARREAQRREHEAALLAAANRTLAALGRLGRQLLLETTRDGIARRIAAAVPRLLPAATAALLAAGEAVPPAAPGAVRLVRRLRLGDAVHGTLVVALGRRSERAERQLLRTLAAWVALACAHVAALDTLQRTRVQLLLAQADAEQAQQRLRQAVEQRRRFAGFISHDLRSPLATLQGLLETLRHPPPALPEADRARYARQAREVAARLQALVGELGELAAQTNGMHEPQAAPLVLPPLVHRVFARRELEAARRGLQLELWREQDLPPALADAGMVERVLVNLVDNAVRHAAPGGRVRVELASDGASVRVAVLNDGEPIAPEQRHALFRHPGVAPMRHRSAGLGLLAVQRLLALHGSQVRAPGRPGWAAAFEFALPAGG